jgi:branched-chain amino acid transport system substrate-binding protein
MTRLLLRLAGILVLWCGLWPCAYAAPQKTLRLGAVLSLTGMASAHGNAIRDGMELAKHQLTSEGWDVHILYEDDGTVPKNTVAGVENLVRQGRKLIIGPTWGILSKPAATNFRRHNAISLQPCNSSDFVSGDNTNYFFIFSRPSSAKSVIVEFLKNQRGKKVALINNISDWGVLWQRLFQDAAAEVGAEIVLDEMVQFFEFDAAVPTLVTKLRSKGAEVVLSTTSKEGVALTLAQLENQKVRVSFLSPDLVDAVGEGLVRRESAFVDGYSITPIDSPQFSALFEKHFGRKPRKYSDTAYDGVIALAKSVEAVGDDVETVKDYLEHTLDMQGLSGRIKFDSNHDTVGAGYGVQRDVE